MVIPSATTSGSDPTTEPVVSPGSEYAVAGAGSSGSDGSATRDTARIPTKGAVGERPEPLTAASGAFPGIDWKPNPACRTEGSE